MRNENSIFSVVQSGLHFLTMDSDVYYETEHFYNEEIAENDSEFESDCRDEDLSKLGYFELAKRFLGKKELPKIETDISSDFSTIQKNLYVQVSEITNLLDHEVAAIRQANGPIRIRGKVAPRPITSFAQAGLPEVITRYLAKNGIAKPFPIQMQAIPALLCGRDIVGIAQTGQGKTLAFLLPLLKHVGAQEQIKHGDGPIALIIGPTRELALQIYKELVPLAKLMGLRSVCAYGGAPLGEQLGKLKAQVEILVATPGRLIDVLTASKGKVTNLRRTSFVVLDEADRMFDMGFEPQVVQVLQSLNPKRQLAMFSATFPPHVEGIAKKHLQKPLEIVVGDGGIGVVGSNINQSVEVLKSDQERMLKTLQLLGEWAEHGSIIIFTQTKEEVDSLFSSLIKHGYTCCLTLHGGQDQADRDSTIEDFKRRKSPNILIATSVASRGLDVKHVVLVINFRVPEHLEDYIHRVGRTGRAGQPGFAFTFICPDESEKAEGLVEALKSSGQKVPAALSLLAQQHQAQVNLGIAKKRTKWSGFSGGSGFKFDSSEKSKSQKDKEIERLKQFLASSEQTGEDFSNTPPHQQQIITKQPPPMMPTNVAAPKGPPPGRPGKPPPPPPPPGKHPSALAVSADSKSSKELALSNGILGGPGGPSATTQYFLKKMGGVVPVPPAPAGLISEEFEINEYPELARAKGVTRDFRVQLEDRYNVRISLKGQYIESGSVVPPGARKLFVEISGTTKHQVLKAKKDIFDSVEEWAIKTLNISEERLKPKRRRRSQNF